MGKGIWTDDLSRKVLVIMVEDKDKGNSKFHWGNYAKVLNAQTGRTVTGKQVKNHYSDLKDRYKAWEELQRLTGIAYNPVTKEVDVEERGLERWQAYLQRHSKYGSALAKKEPANLDLLHKLFEGQSAHGVGGCFSPAMGSQPSYLCNSIEDLTINEVEEEAGDSGSRHDEDAVPNLSTAESTSPPKSALKRTASSSGSKRKSEDTIDCTENKRRETRLDTVIELLSKSVDAPHPPPPPSKADRICEMLEKLGIDKICGPAYFVAALTFLLSEERHSDGFLALKNDDHKWIFLKQMTEFKAATLEVKDATLEST